MGAAAPNGAGTAGSDQAGQGAAIERISPSFPTNALFRTRTDVSPKKYVSPLSTLKYSKYCLRTGWTRESGGIPEKLSHFLKAVRQEFSPYHLFS